MGANILLSQNNLAHFGMKLFYSRSATYMYKITLRWQLHA